MNRPSSPRALRLLLVRHAESEANAQDTLSTVVPGPPLTARGARQAEVLAAALGAEAIRGVAASTMLRARQTAVPLARAAGLEVVEHDGFSEIEAGDEEGRPGSDALRRYLAPIALWAEGDYSAVVPGAHDGAHFLDRFDEAIESIGSAREPGATVVVVSHSVAIRVWVGTRAENAAPAYTSSAPLDNCGVVELHRGTDEHFVLVRWQEQTGIGGRFER